MKKSYFYLLLPLMVFLLYACKPGKSGTDKLAQGTYQVKKEAITRRLNFTGTIQPLSEQALSAPAEATVESMNFHYGQWVHKGQVIMTLNSTELQKQYNDTLTEYLKAKDNFNITQAKFNGTKELWKAGLISKNNFMSEQSSVDTARMSLMQASRKLNEMLEKMDAEPGQNLSRLSLADFEQVKKVLATNHNIIHLKASSDGIVLYPPKSGEDKNNRVSVGSTVKSGQVLALVGNLTGVSVEIDVPEVDIDKIESGMQASITGIAFGGETLKGRVTAVNSQASNTSPGGLPSFSAVVEVPMLTAQQRDKIKVGMSAAIELTVSSPDQIMIPIKAVKLEKGVSMVEIKTPEGKKIKRAISTGAATADKVIVTTGLKAGEVIFTG